MFVACGNKSNSNSSIDYAEIREKGYNNGYEQGYYDGRNNNSYLTSYTLFSLDNYGKQSPYYESGYKQGYDKGYKEGKITSKAESSSSREVEYNNTDQVTVTTSSTPNVYDIPSSSYEEKKDGDFHNWEEDEIRAFYVEIEDCESDEKAEYISNEYYLGEYIVEGGRYFAKASAKNGTYEAELGEKVSSKLFKIKGTDMFVLFKWLPNASKWDEGVLEVWGNKGSFYKKP